MRKLIIFALILLSFVGTAQDSSYVQTSRPEWLPDGILVKPKMFRGFLSYTQTDILPAIQDPETKYTDRTQGFGTYVFDFDNEIVQFWVNNQLQAESEIFFVKGVEDTVCHVVAIYYDAETKKSTTYKFYIFWGDDLDLTFAIWWFDENYQALRGELTEKAKVIKLNRK